MNNDTIFALSSASGQAGVAVIRVSGKKVLDVYDALTDKNNPQERCLQCNYILDENKKPVDQAMTVYFKAPKSFTGEDVLEIHCHGSRAVISKILSLLSNIPDCRMAERGEFTRRAVYHNKMDLTAAEGLSTSTSATIVSVPTVLSIVNAPSVACNIDLPMLKSSTVAAVVTAVFKIVPSVKPILVCV